MPAAPPRVSILIVNYNGSEHLPECLAALTADQAGLAEIIVVDNASTDASLARLAALPANFRLISSSTNRGYAGGVNLALPDCQGEYLAVLNPDIIVTPGWLKLLVDFMDAHPAAGAVNPLVVLYGDEGHINAAGQDVHITGLGFNRWLGRPAALAGNTPTPVSGLQGGAFLIRRAILERLGGWDASGFLYHEDVELSWRLQLNGYDLYCVPAAVVRHKYHLTMYPEKLYLLERNRVGMLLTHLETGTLLLLAPFLAVTEGMLWGYCLWRGWAFLKAKAAAYVWLTQPGSQLRQRRRRIRAERQRSDGQVLRRLKWSYAWDQFFTLGRERGPSRRQPAGGLPVNLNKPHA